MEKAPEPAKPLTLRQSCAIRAQKFIGKYYANTPGGLGLETEGVKLLKKLSKDLDKPGSITQILKALKDKDGGDVSTFEFLKSGTVQDLRNYLTGRLSFSVLRTQFHFQSYSSWRSNKLVLSAMNLHVQNLLLESNLSPIQSRWKKSVVLVNTALPTKPILSQWMALCLQALRVQKNREQVLSKWDDDNVRR